MTILHATYRLARDCGAAWSISAARRRRWRERLRQSAAQYWPDLDPTPEILFARRAYGGNGVMLLRGQVASAGAAREFWLRWCPHEEPEDLRQTVRRMCWWRAVHPALREPVADVFDCWPDERMLVLAGLPGKPLAGWLRGQSGPSVDRPAGRFGRWLRAYARGQGKYSADVEALCGMECRRDEATGRLFVDARHLLLRRLAHAQRAVRTLVAAGWTAAERWHGGADVRALADTLSDREPAGFVHGDLNLGNVLVADDAFGVVDWWLAPRVSWPLPDVAMVAANLWMAPSDAAGRFWGVFAAAYFDEGLPAREARLIDLLGRMMCLGLAARKLCGPAPGRWVERPWAARMLEQLASTADVIGKV